MVGLKGTRRPLLGQMSVLADPVRCRLLLVLEAEELTVTEICEVLQLPQSTASRQLRILAEGGWVTNRREGTNRRYRSAAQRRPGAAHQLWLLVRQEIGAGAAAAQDRRRMRDVVARRRSRSQEFFSSAAGRWAELRRELFGYRFESDALVGLLDPDWTIGDLGCGTGELTETLAAGVRLVIAVDESAAMLKAARRRLKGRPNIELRRGRIEALPIADGELDAAMLVLVLHYLSAPAQAVREAARALRPGGRLLVVDMLPHEREEYRQQMGHLWLGFEPDELTGWLAAADLEAIGVRPLPTDAEAQGPALFAAVATRKAPRARPTVRRRRPQGRSAPRRQTVKKTSGRRKTGTGRGKKT